MTIASQIVVLLLGLSAVSAPENVPQITVDESRYRVEVPEVVLTSVPVKQVQITAVDPEGKLDASFSGRPLINGIRLVVNGRETALPAFVDGVLELKTDLAAGRKVYIADSRIVVEPESRHQKDVAVWRTLNLLCLVPPVLAVLLAVWLRNALIALFIAVWSGAVILEQGNLPAAFLRTLDTYVVNELLQSGNSNHDHMLIVLSLLLLGATVGVVSGSGGASALVGRLARLTQKREHGQILTWGAGIAVFFDRVTGILLAGSFMRPATDRLKISREKLAFLVDATAGAVAGLAVVSTCVVIEVGVIADACARLGIGADAYSIFLQTLPYRFYPLHLLVFVWLVAYTGRDFGPMLRAEARAFELGELSRKGAFVAADPQPPPASETAERQYLRNALVPLAVFLGSMVIGLWWTGTGEIAAADRGARTASGTETVQGFWTILADSNPNRGLLLSAFMASIAAVAAAVSSRAIAFAEAMEAWISGARNMFLPISILVLAWAVATICDENHLNTAGFLVEYCRGNVAANWVPALAFALAAAVSLATGSLWSAVGILVPLFMSTMYQLLVAQNGAGNPSHHLMLGTIGGVLSGAIFGSHCSPISDTTVISSAAAACDHVDHVTTQIPYAGTVALVSLLFGYVPIGFGYSPVFLLPLGLLVLYLVVQFLGRPCENVAEAPDSATAPGGVRGRTADLPNFESLEV
jgi:Na+/H+ antiporter NhaC